MLKAMRMNLKSLSFTLWLVIFAFIGTTFLVWGIRSTPGGGMARAGIIAQIDKEKVSIEEFREAYRTLYEHYRKSMGDKFDEEMAERMRLKQRALDDLINQRLIQLQARKMGIEVREEEVMEAIRDTPGFQENGQFSKQRYLYALQYHRLTPQRFENNVRLDLLLTKIQSYIRDGARVSDLEARDLYLLANNRAKVEFIELAMKDYKKEDAEALAKKMREAGGWAKTAAQIQRKPRQTGYLYYNLPFPEVPDPAPFIKAAFSLKKGEVSPLVEGKDRYYVLYALENSSSDEKALQPAQTDSLKQQIALEKRDRLLKEWLEEVKRSRKIQIEESLLKG